MFQDVLHFWFEEIESSQWWVKDETFDQTIIEKFSAVHARACACELFDWRKESRGRLAEIIVLDQFSRNMFRDSAMSFVNDPLALVLSQEAISTDADKALDPIERSFLYMPFMHSESKSIHEVAANLYKHNGIQSNYEFEMKHKGIIDQFGRYPHRNSILGRISTEDEIEFLNQPGASF